MEPAGIFQHGCAKDEQMAKRLLSTTDAAPGRGSALRVLLSKDMKTNVQNVGAETVLPPVIDGEPVRFQETEGGMGVFAVLHRE